MIRAKAGANGRAGNDGALLGQFSLVDFLRIEL